MILGALKGNAQAGCMGDRNCFIFALDMQPIQIQIGDLIAKSPDKAGTETSYTPPVKDTGSGSTDRHCKRWKYLY